MASTSYESALEIAQSLSTEERLLLIQELTQRPGPDADQSPSTSILDLCGLGADIWRHVDAQEYVRSERSTWAG